MDLDNRPCRIDDLPYWEEILEIGRMIVGIVFLTHHFVIIMIVWIFLIYWLIFGAI
jgi:uncharacterized protein (DUF983 family)